MDATTLSLFMDLLELVIEMNDQKIDHEFMEHPTPSELMHDRLVIVRGRLHAHIAGNPLRNSIEQADGV